MHGMRLYPLSAKTAIAGAVLVASGLGHAGCADSRRQSGYPNRTYTANYAELYDDPSIRANSSDARDYDRTMHDLQRIQRNIEQGKGADEKSFWDWFDFRPDDASSKTMKPAR
jgi:hypothetical protein